ncbi:hypothetical protein BH23CHL5_BH23CHL5_11570 [soil metagenome]
MENSFKRVAKPHIMVLDSKIGAGFELPLSETSGSFANQGGENGTGQGIDVQVASALDHFRIARGPDGIDLNQPESNLASSASKSIPVGKVVRRTAQRPSLLVARENRSVAGFGEFTPYPPDMRWQLVTIGYKPSGSPPTDVWTAILNEGTRIAGSLGVKRLYARAPVGSEIELALSVAGYAPYADEIIFQADNPQALTTGVDAREQDQSDTWAVHQLYNGSVPKEVLYAEAYTSHRWELPQSRVSVGKETRAWLCERNHTPVTYARCVSARHHHVLDLIGGSGNLDEMGRLIDEVIIRLRSAGPIRAIFCAVRGYHSDVERLLEERQFHPTLHQSLSVRYTTAPLRVMTAEMVFSDIEVAERSRKRVPVYLLESNGQDPQPGPQG